MTQLTTVITGDKESKHSKTSQTMVTPEADYKMCTVFLEIDMTSFKINLIRKY